jgi:hypothetical protein
MEYEELQKQLFTQKRKGNFDILEAEKDAKEVMQFLRPDFRTTQVRVASTYVDQNPHLRELKRKMEEEYMEVKDRRGNQLAVQFVDKDNQINYNKLAERMLLSGRKVSTFQFLGTD